MPYPIGSPRRDRHATLRPAWRALNARLAAVLMTLAMAQAAVVGTAAEVLGRSAPLGGATLAAGVDPAGPFGGDVGGSGPPHRPPSIFCRDGGEAVARTDLYFGLSRPGGVVSEDEFRAFVDAHVSSRFPDGLTLVDGVGHFRDARGTTIREGSKLLILLYSRDDVDAGSRIEAIRSDYRALFQQESVLRTDDLTCAQF